MRLCRMEAVGSQRISRGLISRQPVFRVVALLPAKPPKPSQQAPPVRNPGLNIRTAAQLTAEDVKTLSQHVSGPLRTHQTTTMRDPLPAEPLEGKKLQDADMVWVFSYGGSMCCETLTKRDIAVYARDPAFVVDPSVRLVFKHRGGHATLLSLPEGASPRFRPPGAGKGQPCVHGVLYRMRASDVRLMESREHGYVMTQMEVETYDGMRVKANVWVSGPLSLLPQEVTPPEIYMRKLRDGAAFNFIDPSYQAWLSSIETVTSAGLPLDTYYNTPGRYISYSLMMVSLFIIGGWLSQHL